MHRVLPLVCACVFSCRTEVVHNHFHTAVVWETEPTTGPTLTTTPPTTTTPGTTTTPIAHLVEGAPVVCSDPAARATGHFRRLVGANLPADTESTWGAGLIVADFDGDGMSDLFVPGQDGQQVWLAVPAADPADAGLTRVREDWVDAFDLSYGVGGIAGDVDGDGDLDLLITRWAQPNALLLNDGQGVFTDATPPVFQTHSYRTQSANLVDFDGDGDLDLLFGNYGEKPPQLTDPSIPPADPSELYENDGGVWVDRSDSLPQEMHDGYTFMSVTLDLNGDGLPEILSSQDFVAFGPTVLLWNRGGWDFDLESDFHHQSDMGVAVGDVNEDGAPDFLFTSYLGISVLQSGDALGLPGQWIEAATAWGITLDLDGQDQRFGWGTDWGDLDNDGDLDAVAMMGFWQEWFFAAGQGQRDALWLQEGPLQFVQHGQDPLWALDDPGAGRGLVLADWNQDGWLDVFKRQADDWAVIYTARCGDESWLEVLLEAPSPNTRALGATVQIEVGSQTQTRWIQAGSTSQYVGLPPEAHFGLGEAEIVDRVRVIWPDGQVSEFDDVSARQRLTVVRD